MSINLLEMPLLTLCPKGMGQVHNHPPLAWLRLGNQVNWSSVDSGKVRLLQGPTKGPAPLSAAIQPDTWPSLIPCG